jgi:hypothetical protein
MNDYQSTIAPEYQPTDTDRILSLSKENETLKDSIEELQTVISGLRRQIHERDMQMDSVRSIIADAFEMEDFDKEVVTSIADALGIELTKEYSVTINVTFSGTITAPIGMDPDEFERMFDFSAEPSGWGDSYELECDLFEDGIDFNINQR